MKIGFVSPFAPDDRQVSSGTNFKLFETLSAEHSVVHIPYKRDTLTKAYGSVVEKLARVRGKRADPDFTSFASRRLGRTIDHSLVDKVDVLFFPFAAPCLAGFDTTKPVIYLSDTTFEALYGYYPYFSNFMMFNYKQGNLIEREALEKSFMTIVSSHWAKSSAVNDYGQDPKNIQVIHFGANLLEDDPESIRKLCLSGHIDPGLPHSPLSMLFMGVDWERKGGDIAVDCCRVLNELGIPARLSVVGAELPARHRGDNYIEYHGFLNKNDPEDHARLAGIMCAADILLLPTQAECSAIVFCEASAYGLPSFTINTGGTPDYVENGVNGYALPPGSTGADFAAKIAKTISSGELERLREGAFKAYAQRLNWKLWLDRFNGIISNLSGNG